MTEWVAITAHARRRFRQRADQPDPPVGPRVAWIEGEPVAPPHGLSDADAVRYHAPTSLALVRNGDDLVTVIAVDEHAKASLRHAVARSTGGASA